MKKFKFILLFIFLISLSCYSDLEDYNNASEVYYMPDVDIFIVMGQATNPTTATVSFEVPLGITAAQFVLNSFNNDDTYSVNYFLTQLGVAFYHSRIRIFYIRLDPVDVGLTSMTGSTQFALTDVTGIVDKGIVYNEWGPVKIYLAGDTTPAASYSGLGYLAYLGLFVVSTSSGISSNNWLTRVIVHELGHNFGLPHPFDGSGNPNADSCQGAVQGSTNRIMDYTGSPEIFIPCERFIASVFAEQYNFRKKIYNPSETADNVELYTGNWTGTITVGQAPLTTPITKNLIIETD